jgi:hypothetical protein
VKSDFLVPDVSLLRTQITGDRFWIIGKGPSIDLHMKYPVANDVSLALNHACLIVPTTIAHFTDYEAFRDCADYLRESRHIVVMPWTPHIRNCPRGKSLSDLMMTDMILRGLLRESRLYCYGGSNGRDGGHPTRIELRYFSVEPAYQICVALGAKQIRTLGIDGGTQYGSSVQGKARSRLLSNGRRNFDVQWKQLERLKLRYQVPMEPAASLPTVYVGVAERELVPFRVLEWSIKKNATIPVRVLPLPQVRRMPQHRQNRPRTPFSFSRFLIPELMGYQGRAIYMDSDMLVFADIAELFNLNLEGRHVGVTRQDRIPDRWLGNEEFKVGRQYSVMVIDCENCAWNIDKIIDDLDRGVYSYADLLHDLVIEDAASVLETLDPRWNSLEFYEQESTKNLHFTVVPTQPWKYPKSEFGELWYNAFAEAISDGFIDEGLIRKSVRRGHVHKKCLAMRAAAAQKQNDPSENPDPELTISGGHLEDICFRTLSIVRNVRWRISLRLGQNKATKPST